MRVPPVVVGVFSVSLMVQAALGQGTESRATVPSNVMPNPLMPGATKDTILVPQDVLRGLAESEPDIAAPEAPPWAGMVSLKVLVSKTGAVEEVAVEQGDNALRKVAADGVKGWKYRPYLVNGEAREIQSWIMLDFREGVGTRVPAPPSGAPPNLGGWPG